MKGKAFMTSSQNWKNLECEFETLHDSLIKNMIVCGTNDNSLRERLLRDSELTLPKAISAGHAVEETRKHAREILKSNENIDLHKISKHSKSRSDTSAQSTEIIKKCKFCENSHHRGKCPAYGKVCYNFNRKNHFKKFGFTYVGVSSYPTSDTMLCVLWSNKE